MASDCVELVDREGRLKQKSAVQCRKGYASVAGKVSDRLAVTTEEGSHLPGRNVGSSLVGHVNYGSSYELEMQDVTSNILFWHTGCRE